MTPTETPTVTAPQDAAQVPQTPQDSQPQALPQGNPDQEAARRALYEKHYGSGGPPVDIAEPAPVAVAPTAPPAEPVAPPAAAIPPEFIQTMQAMAAELQALKQAVRPQVPADTTHEPEPSWIQLLREGKITEADAALVAGVAKKLQGPTVDQAVQAAVAQATERIRAEGQINEFVSDLRGAHPDLIPMEKFIAADAQERLDAVQTKGLVRTTDDAVREYKKAVLDATESARKIVQQYRGAGKSEGMVRSREVLSASTVTPSGVDSTRLGPPAASEPDLGSMTEEQRTQSYLEKRRTQQSAGRGMA